MQPFVWVAGAKVRQVVAGSKQVVTDGVFSVMNSVQRLSAHQCVDECGGVLAPHGQCFAIAQ